MEKIINLIINKVNHLFERFVTIIIKWAEPMVIMLMFTNLQYFNYIVNNLQLSAFHVYNELDSFLFLICCR